MKTYRLLLVLVLATLSSLASATLPFMSETISWDEDVLLSDGTTLPVRRSATHGPDEFGRSGRGPLKSQTLSFSLHGQQVSWTNDDPWPIAYMPAILDVVDGNPTIVLPVFRFGPCEKYGYPQNGLTSFVYRNNRWTVEPSDRLPKILKVNLLGHLHSLRYWTEYSGRRTVQADKLSLQGPPRGNPPMSASLEDIAATYSRVEDACSRLRPPPDPLLDEAKRKSIAAAGRATTVVATLVGGSDVLEQVSAKGQAEARGEWTGLGYLSATCKGTLKAIEPIRLYGQSGSWQLKSGGHHQQEADVRPKAAVMPTEVLSFKRRRTGEIKSLTGDSAHRRAVNDTRTATTEGRLGRSVDLAGCRRISLGPSSSASCPSYSSRTAESCSNPPTSSRPRGSRQRGCRRECSRNRRTLPGRAPC